MAVAYASAKPSGIAIGAPLIAAPAVVTAHSSQYFARNFNGIVAAPLVVAPPLPQPLALAPSPYAFVPAPVPFAPAPLAVAAPAPVIKYVAAPAPVIKYVAASPARIVKYVLPSKIVRYTKFF